MSPDQTSEPTVPAPDSPIKTIRNLELMPSTVSYDRPAKTLYLVLMFKGSVLVGGNPRSVYPIYGTFQLTSGDTLLPYREVDFHNGIMLPETDQGFNFVIDGENALKAIDNLRNLELLLSLNADPAAPTADLRLSFKDLCASNPEMFVNAETGQIGCP